MPTPAFTAFLFVDVGSARIHIVAFDHNLREWSVPCETIPFPQSDQVTYSPTKRLCQICDKRTGQTFDEYSQRPPNESYRA